MNTVVLLRDMAKAAARLVKRAVTPRDGGREVRFMVEGQSSVNAAASFQADWGRIHTSIEVGVVVKMS